MKISASESLKCKKGLNLVITQDTLSKYNQQMIALKNIDPDFISKLESFDEINGIDRAKPVKPSEPSLFKGK